jgi:HD-GYP domain-containing protein (c-di-GMP phosphodiesterase class II)
MNTAEQIANFDYIPLPLGFLSGELPAIDLYVPALPRPVLYRDRMTPVERSDLQALRDRGIEELWVLGDDRAEIDAFLSVNLGTMLGDEKSPPHERVRLLSQAVSRTLRNSLNLGNPVASVLATQTHAQQLASLALRSDLTIRDVTKIARHDYCTFSHSANVACYCTLLAKAMGITDEQELQSIAVAAMLHDLGKLNVPLSILTKPDRLTAQEFAQMKLHPTRGFQALRFELTTPQLMLVYQHHEKIDGSGYPVGCTGEEIHWWARICAVTDVYEALTGMRPYRRGCTSSEALAIMRRGSGTHFDQEIFRCWQRHFITDVDV